MDFTLAVYKNPNYEELCYNEILKKLVNKGYPEDILNLKYNHSFPVRGLFLDKKYGTLLKIDNFGYILICVYGRKKLSSSEIRKLYPDRIIHHDIELGTRYYTFDSLFGLPEICLYADMVEYFGKKSKRISSFEDLTKHANEETSEQKHDLEDYSISYWSLFDDIRQACHFLHIDAYLKQVTIDDIEKYITRDDRLAHLFHQMRENGKKIFLLTNSPPNYTIAVMSYLLDGVLNQYNSWKDYFDIIITNAQKPTFFKQGSTLREVDEETGHLKFTTAPDTFQKGTIYAGGSFALFKQITKTKGPEVLYVGDNIFSDIIYSRKVRCLWRTLLIVRELDDEITKWVTASDKYNHLQVLKYMRAKTFENTDSSTKGSSNEELRGKIAKYTRQLDEHFNPYFGSLFRTGTKESHFHFQCMRYADLYASDVLHLLNYPFYYYFSVRQMNMVPHEIQFLKSEMNS